MTYFLNGNSGRMFAAESETVSEDYLPDKFTLFPPISSKYYDLEINPPARRMRTGSKGSSTSRRKDSIRRQMSQDSTNSSAQSVIDKTNKAMKRLKTTITTRMEQKILEKMGEEDGTNEKISREHTTLKLLTSESECGYYNSEFDEFGRRLNKHGGRTDENNNDVQNVNHSSDSKMGGATAAPRMTYVTFPLDVTDCRFREDITKSKQKCLLPLITQSTDNAYDLVSIIKRHSGDVIKRGNTSDDVRQAKETPVVVQQKRRIGTSVSNDPIQRVKCEENQFPTRPRIDRTDAMFKTKLYTGQLEDLASLKTKASVLAVYIHSAVSDCEVERTEFIRKVYPSIRDYSRSKGVSLRIFDLHWGTSSSVFDDHAEENSHLDVLKSLHSSSDCSVFATLMSHKYGEPLLKSELLQSELDPVLGAIERTIAKYIKAADAAARAAAVAAAADSDAEGETGKDPNEADKVISGKLEEPVRIIKDLYNLLTIWYQLDINPAQPVYRLIKPSSIYPDAASPNHLQRTAAYNNWIHTGRKLRTLIQEYSQKTKQRNKTNCSLSQAESELDQWLSTTRTEHVENGVVPFKSVWFRKIVDEIQENLLDPGMEDFVDLIRSKPVRNEVLAKALESMIDTKLEALVPVENRFVYRDIPLTKYGLDPETNRSHRLYLDKLCTDFCSFIFKCIDGCSNAQTSDVINTSAHSGDIMKTSLGKNSASEIEAHARACKIRTTNYVYNHDREMSTMKEYVTGTENRPLVLVGKAGCGLTTLMAKVSTEVHKWFEEDTSVSAACLVRLVGETSESVNITSLLRGICLQLCVIYGDESSDVPKDFRGVFNGLHSRLKLATQRRPLILLIDSIHNLFVDHNSKNLSWLPAELPAHVRLIISTIDSAPLFQSLLRMNTSGQRHNIILELPVEIQPPEAVISVANIRLRRANRNLTDEQHGLVRQMVSGCPTLLFTNQVVDEALGWASYFSLDECKTRLGATVKAMTLSVITRTEREYTETLVRRALGYITASRSGLAVDELEDVLSLDESVMDEVCATYRPPLRRLPSLLLFRLLRNLRGYLTERDAGNCRTVNWSQSQFREVAEDRYLKQRDKAPSYHKVLAEYFSDRWSRVAKPYGNDNNKSALRFVQSQPLYWVVEDGGNKQPRCGSEEDPFQKRVYNLRRLDELPFHLVESQQLEMLKSSCLCNWDFILARIASVQSMNEIMEDFRAALALEPSDKDLKLVMDALQMSSPVLTVDPRSVMSQLAGRLQRIVAEDKPIAPKDPFVYPCVKQMFAGMTQFSIPSLVASTTCLVPPTNQGAYELLSGHRAPITAIATTRDGLRTLTASKDNTMRLWDMLTGRTELTVSGIGKEVSEIRFCLGDTVAATVEKTGLHVWCLRTGTCLGRLDDSQDPATTSTAGTDGSILVACYHGLNLMRIWDLTGSVQGTLVAKESSLKIPPGPVAQQRISVTSSINVGSRVLHAFRNSSLFTVFDVVKGSVVKSIQANAAVSITCLAQTNDYFVCCARSHRQANVETSCLELFDAVTYKFVRSIKGCGGDASVRNLYINTIGSHALVFCSSESNHLTHVALWNLETEEHKHLARHGKLSPTGTCSDLRYVMSAADDESSVRVWDLKDLAFQKLPKEKPGNGIERVLVERKHSEYVLSQSSDGRQLRLWNVAKNKSLGTVITKVQNLCDASDVVLTCDSLIVCLCDKSYDLVTDDELLVYQTIRKYDLVSKQFLQPVNNCSIVFSPPEYYTLLNRDQLLGLSENRSHLVIWSLTTGIILHRIRSEFREHILRSRTEDDLDGSASARTASVATPGKKSRVMFERSNESMTPWARRNETRTAKKRRHQAIVDADRMQRQELIKEKKYFPIVDYLISGDLSTVVASYFGHHLCVFDIQQHQKHVQTLDSPSSLLHLQVAAITHDGGHVVVPNYDEDDQTGYLTLWNCRTGSVARCLRSGTGISSVAISDDATMAVYVSLLAEDRGKVFIWDTQDPSNGVRRLSGYKQLKFDSLDVKIRLVGFDRAVIASDEISVWDLKAGLLLATFTPDARIRSWDLALDGQLIVFGMHDQADIVTMKLVGPGIKDCASNWARSRLYGEIDSSDDDDDDDDDGNSRDGRES